MKTLFLSLILIFSVSSVVAQRVGRYPPKIYIENYNTVMNDGVLCFEIDVKVADCLSYLELIDMSEYKYKKNIFDKIHDWWWFKILKIYNFDTEKKITKNLDVDNYYLKDTEDNSEIIMMKSELLSIKSLFGRKYKKKVRINVYSLSSKRVFSKEFEFDKNKLIEDVYQP